MGRPKKPRGFARRPHERAPSWALSEQERVEREEELERARGAIRKHEEWARRYADEMNEKYGLKEDEPL